MYCQYEECIIECWVDITFMKIIVIKINCSAISFKIINITLDMLPWQPIFGVTHNNESLRKCDIRDNYKL